MRRRGGIITEMKVWKLHILPLLFSLCAIGCSAYNYPSLPGNSLSDFFESPILSDPGPFATSQESTSTKLFNSFDISIVAHHGVGFTSGVATEKPYSVFKHSVKHHYSYYQYKNSTGEDDFEEYVCEDPSTNVARYRMLYRNTINMQEYDLDSVNIAGFHSDLLEYVYERIQNVNPNIASFYSSCDLNSYRAHNELVNYLFYVLTYPEKTGDTYLLDDGRLSDALKYPRYIVDYSMTQENDSIDIKYTLKNGVSRGSETMSIYRFSDGASLLSDITSHYVFKRGLPVYCSRYYKPFGDQMFIQEDGYYEAFYISYDPLPDNPDDLFGKDYGVEDESGLLNSKNIHAEEPEYDLGDKRKPLVEFKEKPEIPEREMFQGESPCVANVAEIGSRSQTIFTLSGRLTSDTQERPTMLGPDDSTVLEVVQNGASHYYSLTDSSNVWLDGKPSAAIAHGLLKYQYKFNPETRKTEKEVLGTCDCEIRIVDCVKATRAGDEIRVGYVGETRNAIPSTKEPWKQFHRMTILLKFEDTTIRLQNGETIFHEGYGQQLSRSGDDFRFSFFDGYVIRNIESISFRSVMVRSKGEYFYFSNLTL